MTDKREIPITNIDADDTWLSPPGHPGSLMDVLIAAGTHRKVEVADGLVIVVPVGETKVNEIINVIRRV